MQPHHHMGHYHEWLDTQITIGSSLDADHEEISEAERVDLSNAVRHALHWLDVPAVLRVVADAIELFDQAQADDDDVPF